MLGPKIEISMRLREPLLKKELAVKQEKWVQLVYGTPVTTSPEPSFQHESSPQEKLAPKIDRASPQLEKASPAASTSSTKESPLTPKEDAQADIDDLVLQFKGYGLFFPLYQTAK